MHRGDLLLGADGHRSLVRRHVAPDRPDAEFAGYVIWLDILDAGPDCLLGYPLKGADSSTEPAPHRAA